MRKKFIWGLLILLCVAVASWCSFLVTDSRKNVRVDLTFIGTTNSSGQQFALFRLNNSGRRTVAWSSADIPWLCRAEVAQGWTNFEYQYMTGPGWLRPAKGVEFKVALPVETRRWQVGVSFEEASPRMELGARIYHIKSVQYVPDFVWNLIPGTPGKDHEVWSKVFTNFSGANP